MRKLPVFVLPEVCGPCGAAGHSCCVRLPGLASPDDFGAPDVGAMLDLILSALRSGRWSLDWWEGEAWNERQELQADVFIVAPALRGEEGELLYPETLNDAPAWYGPTPHPCTFLRDDGCELDHDARPLECRALEPSPPECKPHAGARRERAIEWWPYQGVIARAREMLG